MNELLKVNEDNQTVSARDLHDVLEATERFSVWIQRYIPNFIEGEDFTSVSKLTVVNNGAERELEDYALTIDTAKHICLMSRTEKGKQCRQYLIDIEKAWNTPEQIMARALKVADETIRSLSVEVKALSNKIDEMQPKVSYLDKILESKDTVLVTQIAKDYGMSAKGFNKMLHDLCIQHKVGGQWVLYSKYQGEGYTHSHTHSFDYEDGSKGTSLNTEWTQKGRLFLYNFLKEHGRLPLIEQED